MALFRPRANVLKYRRWPQHLTSNLISLNAPGTEDDMQYQYDQCTNGQGRLCTVTLDSNGNTSAQNNFTFTYSSDNRLKIALQSGSLQGSYQYNGLGQRVSKADGSSTHFVYDQGGKLIGEYAATGALLQETIYLGDLPVALLR